jgi:tetratricopeptide (TPR) repeat protein
MTFSEGLKSIRALAFTNDVPMASESELNRLLQQATTPLEEKITLELMALAFRKQQNYLSAITIYKQLGNAKLCGYCAFLQGNLEEATAYWHLLESAYPRHWYIALQQIATKQLQFYPSLLQIRNNLEADLANLIEAKQFQLLECMLSYVPSFSQVNLEAPKLAGRALLHGNYTAHAGQFLLLGQKTLPSDPEVYYHLGQYHAEMNNIEESILMLKQCLMISSTYSPARKLMQSVQKQVS